MTGAGNVARMVATAAVVMCAAPPSSWAMAAEDGPAAMTPATGEAAPFADATGAFEWLVEGGSIEDPRLAEAEALVGAASASEPTSGRWLAGVGLAAGYRGDWKSAKKTLDKAVDLAPRDAMVHYALGNALFNTIDEASLFNKGAIAKRGRKMYEKAIELDPSYPAPRMALAQFYLHAPGIAGGSVKKAMEIGQELVTIEGGAYLGHIVLAQAAMKQERWADMDTEYERALAAAPDADARRRTARNHVRAVLGGQGDAETAAALAERYLAEQEDAETSFFCGVALLQAGQAPAARPYLAGAIEDFPEAATPRYYWGLCLEETGDAREALAVYRAFLDEHGDHKQAKEARKAIKRLEKRLR